MSDFRTMICPECGRVASVASWCDRPICVHSWDGDTPEVWDGNNTDGDGRLIEGSPNVEYRTPGPNTWSEMVPASARAMRNDNFWELPLALATATLLASAVGVLVAEARGAPSWAALGFAATVWAVSYLSMATAFIGRR